MGRHLLLQEVEKEQMKDDIINFEIGDTLKVSTKIIEGEKERVQVFQGTVIAKKGSGISETFTLHRLSYGEGMERVFCLHSPRIKSLEVMRKGKVRRAKLNYLKGSSGKAAKVKERIVKVEKKAKQKKMKEKEEVKVSDSNNNITPKQLENPSPA